MIKTIERSQAKLDNLIDRSCDSVVVASERAEKGVASAADQVVQTVQAAGEKIRERAEAASLNAHQRVAGAAQAIDRGYSQAKSDLTRAAAETTDYVTANPGKALLVAASAGFLLGLLIRGRRSSA